MTPLSLFEERLLAELTDVIETRAAAPARSPRRRVLTLTAAGTAVAGAATAVSVGLVGGAGTATPAYAVERDGGSVGVTIHDPSRLAGLDQALRQAGVPGRVVPMSRSCTEPQPRRFPDHRYVFGVSTDLGGTNTKVTTFTKVTLFGPPLPDGYELRISQLSPGTGMTIVTEISNQPRTCFPTPPGH
jgi:hypothetical protein